MSFELLLSSAVTATAAASINVLLLLLCVGKCVARGECKERKGGRERERKRESSSSLRSTRATGGQVSVALISHARLAATWLSESPKR